MSRESLVRNLAQAIVDALKSAGHVLLVRGGTDKLVRELEGHVGQKLEAVLPDLLRGAAVGDMESTFGSEKADEAVEGLVATLAESLMESEHVEDVFGDDAVIERDVFRAVRDTLLSPDGAELVAEPASEPLVVKLDTLGYIAATTARRAEPDLLEEALERAARAVRGELKKLNAKALEATFDLPNEGPDARIELEEAVAEELEALVDMRLVKLPTVERRVSLTRTMTAAQLAALRPRIEAVVTQRSRGSADARIADDELVLTITPLSEQDAAEVVEVADRLVYDMRALLATILSPDALDAADDEEEDDDDEHDERSTPIPASAKPPTSSKAPASAKAPTSTKAPTSSKAPASAKAPTSSKAPASAKAPASTKAKAAAKDADSEKPAKKAAAKKAAAKKA